MTTSFAPLTVAIGDLVPHPANVRSNAPETYDPENIAHLKASIAVLGLLQPLLVAGSDSEDCQELPASSDPYMAVRPKRPTCYAPSDAVCPGCTTGKPCPIYPPPRSWAPAPRYMPGTPPGSPRSHVPHTAVGPHIPRAPPLTAQDPPTIPKLSERYRESIAIGSDSDSPSVEIVPKC